MGKEGDVAIGISTSGKSENVILALKKAKKLKLKTICFCGRYKKLITDFSDDIISIPAKNTARIQEMHITVGQMLCNAIEKDLGLSNYVEIEK